MADISEGIALNNARDFRAKFPMMSWDMHNNFLKDLNKLRKERKQGVQHNTIKALGSRSQVQPTQFTQQPVSGSVPTRRELQLATAARRVEDAPRQVSHQINTTRHQFSLPTPAVSHSKSELVQIAASSQRQQLSQSQTYESSLVENAKSLFKAQVSTGRWYDTLNSTQQARLDLELMKSATDNQVRYLASIFNRDTALSYEDFVTLLLGTHWDAADETLRLNYVHVNRVIPLTENSKRDNIISFFQRFYNLEGVLSKMAVIENTLDMLDVEPMREEPMDFQKYAFLEWALARIVAFYLSPQTQPLPLPALAVQQTHPSSRLQHQSSQVLNVVPESMSRTTSLENLPLPSLIPRRIPTNREPDRTISYETEAEVMRTYQRQDERRRAQGRQSQTPGPSAGKIHFFKIVHSANIFE